MATVMRVPNGLTRISGHTPSHSVIGCTVGIYQGWVAGSSVMTLMICGDDGMRDGGLIIRRCRWRGWFLYMHAAIHHNS